MLIQNDKDLKCALNGNMSLSCDQSVQSVLPLTLLAVVPTCQLCVGTYPPHMERFRK